MANRPEILVADSIFGAGLELLETAANVTYAPDISPEALLDAVPPYHALVVRSRTKVTAQVIEAGRNLRVIGRAGVGLDTVDREAAKARGLTVLNTPEAPTVAVAELTLGLMLCLARGIAIADAGMKGGEWLKQKLLGGELFGNTLGVIGVGRIGSAVVERARAFGMNPIGSDPFRTAEEIHWRGAEPMSFERVLSDSDFLTVHTPLTPDTRGMIGREQLSRMKPGAFLICTARGGIVHEDALADALETGNLAGAALDVYAVEPPGRSRLVSNPKVICTPHIGAMTREAQQKAAVDIARQVLLALEVG